MPAVLRHNEKLELNLVEYWGGVSLAELKAMAAFMAQNPLRLQHDTLTIIQPGCDFDAIAPADLDALFAYYAKLFAPLDIHIMRRSAWVNRSAAAQSALRRWLSGDARALMRSNVRAFDSLPEAADWLLLNQEDLALIERGEGFVDIARFAGADLARGLA